MTIFDLIHWFETWAPPAWQENWDNCGWQIEPGILDQPPGVLVCLTPTLRVMHEAIALKQAGHPVNLIFAHHPLIFSPLKRLQKGEAMSDLLDLAFTHQIGVYSAHTNFDQVANGTAAVLAEVLALQNVTPIVPTQAGNGYGRVGQLRPSRSLDDLLHLIQTRLNPPNLLVSPILDRDQSIEHVAVLGGSGASFLSAVAATKAQVYLTADCKFHQFQESRDRGLILVDAGHYATERPACARLVELFQQQGVAWAMLSQQDEDFRVFAGPENLAAPNRGTAQTP
ncbi:Nif3-like dinuclear metal center hexameric protein [Trichothermofontia sp.]